MIDSVFSIISIYSISHNIIIYKMYAYHILKIEKQICKKKIKKYGVCICGENI